MKIAYLVTVHSNPRLLRAAIKKLSTNKNCAFFIHVDRKVDIQDFLHIDGDNIFFSEQRIPVYWGEFSQIQATLMLVRQATERQPSYDYFVLLQGSDYPLRSGEYIHRFFDENQGGEFINLLKMPAPGYPLSKINKLRYPSDKPVGRFATRALAKLGLSQRDYRRHLEGLEPYSGSAWWALSRSACEYILEFMRCNQHVEEFFRNTFTSDEMFFHTILGNSPFRPRIRRSLVYVDWSIPGNHPAMLNDEHVDFFEAQEKIWVQDEWGSGEILFARKFSDDRLDLVERIDAMIKQKDERSATSIPRANA
jgi:hypothetical protein